MEGYMAQLVDFEPPLRNVYERHGAELKHLFLTQHMDYSFGSIYETPLLAQGNNLSEMTIRVNFLIIGQILVVIYARNSLASIIMLRA